MAGKVHYFYMALTRIPGQPVEGTLSRELDVRYLSDMQECTPMAVRRQPAQGAMPPPGRLTALVLAGFFLRAQPGLVPLDRAEYSGQHH